MIRFKETVESTQDEMKILLKSGSFVPHLEAIRANTQTGGRGRMGREWVSRAGNLYASILIRDYSMPVTWIPHWIATTAMNVLEGMNLPLTALRVKWPNDLMYRGEFKLGGILCEKVEDGVIAGIGINIVSSPVLKERKAISIEEAFPGAVYPEFAEVALEQMLEALNHEPSMAELRFQYERHSLYRTGDPITWTDPRSGTGGAGTYVSIGEHGELLVEALEQGVPVRRALYSEEVTGTRRAKA